jgi:hypothetical protein
LRSCVCAAPLRISLVLHISAAPTHS